MRVWHKPWLGRARRLGGCKTMHQCGLLIPNQSRRLDNLVGKINETSWETDDSRYGVKPQLWVGLHGVQGRSRRPRQFARPERAPSSHTAAAMPSSRQARQAAMKTARR